MLIQNGPDYALQSNPTERAAERLYHRVKDTDSERMGGTQVRYDSFGDFVTAFQEEAKDPTVVGAADFLDVINPLQHLPVISQIYREITDDKIKPGARMIGGVVFGGGAGLATSSINAVVEEKTGGDIADNLIGRIALNEESHKIGNAQLSDDPTIRLAQIADEAHIEPPRSEQRFYHIQAASAYIDAGAQTLANGQKLERIVMRDPERMSGTFTRYG